MSESAERIRKDRQRGLSWIDLTFLPISDVGLVVFLALLVMLGVVVVFYAVAFAFTYLLSLGEINRARRYCNQVGFYELEEKEGTCLRRKLYRTNLYFTLVLFVFGIEEGVRYVLHTGPATLEIWMFRFGCLAVFTVVTAVFVVRLHRWLSFKSTRKFQQTRKQIDEHIKALYKKD